MAPELSRPFGLDRLPASVVVEASEAECATIAERLHVVDVLSMGCRFVLRRQGMVVTADGVVEAEVVQSCVVSLEPIAQRVAEAFTVRFVPEGRESNDDNPESPDEIPYRGSTIDLGEAAVEQLALSLDPYPRHPDAELDPAAVDATDVEADAGATSGLLGGLAILKAKP